MKYPNEPEAGREIRKILGGAPCVKCNL